MVATVSGSSKEGSGDGFLRIVMGRNRFLTDGAMKRILLPGSSSASPSPLLSCVSYTSMGFPDKKSNVFVFAPFST